MLVFHSAYTTNKLTLFLGSTDSTFRKYHHHHPGSNFRDRQESTHSNQIVMPLIQDKGRDFLLCSSPVLPNFWTILPSEQEDKEEDYHFIHCETT